MDMIIAVFLGTIGSLIAAEMCVNAPHWAKSITTLAARRLPSKSRADRLEEWLADIDQRRGGLAKLRAALGLLFFAAPGIAKLSRPKPVPGSTPLNRVKLHRFFSVYIRMLQRCREIEQFEKDATVIVVHMVAYVLTMKVVFGRRQ
jgi:hypothetical protein